MINILLEYCKNKNINNYIFNITDINKLINLLQNPLILTIHEIDTLIYILNNYNFDIKSKEILKLYTTKSYYFIKNNIKYDKTLLINAYDLIRKNKDGRISYDDIKYLIKLSYDKNIITSIEKNTLNYIIQNYNLTNKAKEYLISIDF